MKYFFSGLAFFSTMTVVTAAVSICTQAGSATATTNATVVEPIRITESVEILTTDSLVSGMTGDLLIRISAAIALTLEEDEDIEPTISAPQAESAEECEGAECNKIPEAGVLNGNPVNSIDLGRIAASETNPANINVIIAYN